MKKLKDRFEKPVKVAYEKPLNLNVNRKGKSKSLTKEDYPCCISNGATSSRI